MTDPLDIPEFLRRTPGDRPAPGDKPKRVRHPKPKRHPFHLPKTIEPAGLVLLKQMEREKKEKQKARLEALREYRKR